MKKTFIIFTLIAIMFSGGATVTAKKLNNIEHTKMMEISKSQARKQYYYGNFYRENENQLFFKASYGGAYYIDDELYIALKKDVSKLYKKHYTINTDITYVDVDYSMDELVKIIKKIEKNNATLQAYNLKIDIINNVVKMSTTLLENDALSLLEELKINEGVHVVSETVQYDLHSVEILNGDAVDIGGTCTVGFPARNSDLELGFVTAGHCVYDFLFPKWVNVKYDGTTIGNPDNFVFETRATADAAFIKLKDPLFGAPPGVLSNNFVTTTEQIDSVNQDRSLITLGKLGGSVLQPVQKLDME